MLRRVLLDERDLPLLRTLVISFLIIFPSAIYMLSSDFSIIKSVLYIAIIAFPLMAPYGCFVHTVIHKGIFTKKFEFLSHLHYWTVGIFLGESPYTHYTQHIGMHHPENNHRGDLSSTMMYRRDSFIDFLKYHFKFVILSGELFPYLFRKRRIKLLKMTFLGEGSFFAIAALFLYINPLQAAVVFLVPLFIMRSAAACTNWSQHAFLDAADLNNNYKICTTIINSSYNRKCFNDAYHIEHHSYPREHWTSLHEIFEKNRLKYIGNRSVVFHSLSYLNLFSLLMLKKYKTMARYFVDLSGSMHETEIIGLLKERTRKI